MSWNFLITTEIFCYSSSEFIFSAFGELEISFRELPTNLKTIINIIENIELKIVKVSLDKDFQLFIFVF